MKPDTKDIFVYFIPRYLVQNEKNMSRFYFSVNGFQAIFCLQFIMWLLLNWLKHFLDPCFVEDSYKVIFSHPSVCQSWTLSVDPVQVLLHKPGKRTEPSFLRKLWFDQFVTKGTQNGLKFEFLLIFFSWKINIEESLWILVETNQKERFFWFIIVRCKPHFRKNVVSWVTSQIGFS